MNTLRGKFQYRELGVTRSKQLTFTNSFHAHLTYQRGKSQPALLNFPKRCRNRAKWLTGQANVLPNSADTCPRSHSYGHFQEIISQLLILLVPWQNGDFLVFSSSTKVQLEPQASFIGEGRGAWKMARSEKGPAKSPNLFVLEGFSTIQHIC